MISDSSLRAIIADYRLLTNRLEAMLESDSLDTGGPIEFPVFDPETDEPDVRPDIDGTRAQKDWCALMLWAQLWAINKRQNRGATKLEVVEIAKTAGYADGRGWNRWTGWAEASDGRWVVKEIGVEQHLRHYYAEVKRSLPADLA
jgi:hypothetical protein